MVTAMAESIHHMAHARFVSCPASNHAACWLCQRVEPTIPVEFCSADSEDKKTLVRDVCRETMIRKSVGDEEPW